MTGEIPNGSRVIDDGHKSDSMNLQVNIDEYANFQILKSSLIKPFLYYLTFCA